MSKWRTGRKNGRTIYLQLGDEPSDADTMIGVMDTAELAIEAVRSRELLVEYAGNKQRCDTRIAIAVEALNMIVDRNTVAFPDEIAAKALEAMR